MKKTFSITQEGNKARIAIIGNIRNWNNSAIEFHEKLKEIKDNGITDVEVYINSFGGSVFEANEIANIIISFEGTIDFVLGAVCASAATIIVAQVITQKENVTISQFRNGQFMIHNVSGDLNGQIKDIESGLQLMRNLQQNAVIAYTAQTGIKDSDIISMMDKETWMTASEALQKKFITAIIEKADSAPQNFADIKNCGFQNLPEIFKINNQITTEMTLEQINKATGKSFTNEVEAMQYIADLQAENARITSERNQAEIARKNTEIDNILNLAIESKKILPGQKDTYKNLLESSFESAKKFLEDMKPVELLSKKIIQGGKPDETSKSYKELAEKSPETLKEMFENDFAAFNELFKAEYGYDYKK